MNQSFILVAALLLDRAFGEPRRAHPLVGFGRLALWIEERLNRPSRVRRAIGGLALLAVVGPFVVLAWRLEQRFTATGLPLLYLALGGRSLSMHAKRVHSALSQDDLPKSKKSVGMIVSRDTAPMTKADVVRATIESVLENGSDAIFGAIFWFMIAGAPGVVAYRLVNTLDAMWGYKNDRYLEFGWAAARLDDLMNFIPARLTALSYALCGSFGQALHCWRIQARAWDSPNAGPVMAAGAGALSVRLGGRAIYRGQVTERPSLGEGAIPTLADIGRALRLVNHSVLLWSSAIVAGGWALA